MTSKEQMEKALEMMSEVQGLLQQARASEDDPNVTNRLRLAGQAGEEVMGYVDEALCELVNEEE